MTPIEILQNCLREAGSDTEAGLHACDYILSHGLDVATTPEPTPEPLSISAFFAHDIHNRSAQGILNRSLQAAKGLSAAARKDLATALKRGATDSGEAILAFINKYRVQLAKLLTTTQLASVLEGAREVASKIPTVATFPGAVIPPPTLEPQEAVKLVDRLSQLTGDKRAEAIYKLPPEQQTYAAQAVAAKEASTPIVPPVFRAPRPPSGGSAPEDIHLPIIDEAVVQLSEKNVINRQRYDALDSAARNKAFTVAGVSAEETLTNIRDTMAENIAKGADYETFKQKVLESVGQGTFMSDAHSEVIFRTNVQSAFSDGQAAILDHPLIRSGFPYSAYDAIHDDRVRANHLALEKHGIGGTNIYRNDDPVFQMFRPPWDYNDRCGWTPITMRYAAELGIKEAEEWLRTGIEPSPKAFVQMPPFQPPEGFKRAVSAAPLSIQLSLQSLVAFAHDVSKEKRDEGGKWTVSGETKITKKKKIGITVSKNTDKVYITDFKVDDKSFFFEGQKDEEGWHIGFGLTKNRGGNTAMMTHDEGTSPFKVLRGVEESLESFIADKQPEKILFTGEKFEKSRIDFYDRIIDHIAETFGYESKIEEYPAMKEYILTKKQGKSLSTKPEEDTEISLLYGQPEVGGIASATLDTAKPATKVGRHTKKQRVKAKRRSLFKRLRINKKWVPSVALGTDILLGGQPARGGGEEQWITIGGHQEGSKKHAGGFPVQINKQGTIVKGRLKGTNVKDVEKNFNKIKGGGHGKPTRGGGQRGSVGQGSGTHAGPTQGTSGRVENQTTRSGDKAPSRKRADKNRSTSDETAQDGSTKDAASRVGKRLDRYKAIFEAKGHKDAAEWMDLLKDHINNVGPEAALAALGEVKQGTTGTVQYEGAYDELSESKQEADFIKGYLQRAGINLVHTNSTIDPNNPLISSFSAKNLEQLGRKRDPKTGDYIPTDQTFKNKLEESKHLPGLETSEDINIVNGSPVTHFTPDVIAQFDAKYGKGKWIVKSYGAEAYAGYGVFFPQRIKRIQQDAKAVIKAAKSELKEHGYQIARDGEGNIIGLLSIRTSKKGELPGTESKLHPFGTPEFDSIPSKTVKKLGKQIQQAAPSENGTRLPMSPEQALQNDYGISFRRDAGGVPIGITNWDGKDYDFNTPKFDKLGEQDGGALGYAIHRAQEADEWRRQGFESDPKFMVQPAFKAVGVSDYDRALGNTWETAKEGRVHVTTKGGKASAVPFATLVGRGDSLPAVFASEDSKAMEQAVEDAINQLPESERTGQLYAPDVVKTKDGWKVLELNPSAEGGGSDWLGRNPFVIDALASHMTGREPMHVQFIRKLLGDKGVKKHPVAIAPTVTPTQTTAATQPQPTSDQPFVKGGHTALSTDIDNQESVAMAHDVSNEKRDSSGKWTKTGGPKKGTKVKYKGESGWKVISNIKDDGTYRLRLDRSGKAISALPKYIEPEEDELEEKLEEVLEGTEVGTDIVGLIDHRYRYFSRAEHAIKPTEGDMVYASKGVASGKLPTAGSPGTGGGARGKLPFEIEFHSTETPSDTSWGAATVNKNKVKRIFVNSDSATINYYFDDYDDWTNELKKLQKMFPGADVVYVKRKPEKSGWVISEPPTATEDNTALSLDPEQPREPAGTSIGGRFAKKGSSAGHTHTIKHGPLKVRYSLHTNKHMRDKGIPLKNYRQQDTHSCAFVATLTVSRHLKPDTRAKDVLLAVRPLKSSGADRDRLIHSLKELGIEATYHEDLTIDKLRQHVKDGTPVIITVYPEDWSSDHWVVVQGFDENRIYLTNYKSLPIIQFKKEWYDEGEGLVCKPIK